MNSWIYRQRPEAALRAVRAHVGMQKSWDSLQLEAHKLWYYDMYIWSGCILDASWTAASWTHPDRISVVGIYTPKL